MTRPHSHTSSCVKFPFLSIQINLHLNYSLSLKTDFPETSDKHFPVQWNIFTFPQHSRAWAKKCEVMRDMNTGHSKNSIWHFSEQPYPFSKYADDHMITTTSKAALSNTWTPGQSIMSRNVLTTSCNQLQLSWNPVHQSASSKEMLQFGLTCIANWWNDPSVVLRKRRDLAQRDTHLHDECTILTPARHSDVSSTKAQNHKLQKQRATVCLYYLCASMWYRQLT